MDQPGISAVPESAPPSHEVVEKVPVNVTGQPESVTSDTQPTPALGAATGETTMGGNAADAIHVPIVADEASGAGAAEAPTESAAVEAPASPLPVTEFEQQSVEGQPDGGNPDLLQPLQPPTDAVVGMQVQESGTGIESPVADNPAVADAAAPAEDTHPLPPTAPQIENHGGISSITTEPAVAEPAPAPEATPQPEVKADVTEISSRISNMQSELDKLKQDVDEINQRAA